MNNIKSLGFNTYEDYLASDEWKSKRDSLIQYRRRCKICGCFIGGYYRAYYGTKWKDIEDKLIKGKINPENIKKMTYSQFTVHHLNYNNIGNEKLSDLIVVCHECHQKLHNS